MGQECAGRRVWGMVWGRSGIVYPVPRSNQTHDLIRVQTPLAHLGARAVAGYAMWARGWGRILYRCNPFKQITQTARAAQR